MKINDINSNSEYDNSPEGRKLACCIYSGVIILIIIIIVVISLLSL